MCHRESSSVWKSPCGIKFLQLFSGKTEAPDLCDRPGGRRSVSELLQWKAPWTLDEAFVPAGSSARSKQAQAASPHPWELRSLVVSRQCPLGSFGLRSEFSSKSLW